MLPIKEARKQLKTVGTSRAEGDALRFMYANLIAFHACLSSKANSINWPIPEIYTDLGRYPDDKIHAGFKRLRGEWCSSKVR